MTLLPRTRRGKTAAIIFACLLLAIPVYALLPGAGASEVTQLLVLAENAISAIETAQTVLELEDQIAQQLDDAMGRIGALADRFEDLSSDPMNLLEDLDGLSWATDFTGDSLDLLNALADMRDDSSDSLIDHARQAHAAADTVDANRWARAWRENPRASQEWLDRRERADRARAADYLVLDRAEKTIELLASASDSVERSRQQTELADTALAQERHANQLTEIEVDISVAQLLAHHAARDMLAQRQLEIEHQEQLDAWLVAERAELRRARRVQNRVGRSGRAWNRAFLLD